MAIAISAIMLEQTGNMDSVILMMVTVLSSRLVAGFLTPHSFTDEVISMKGYQVLEPREPAVIATLSAGAVCTRDVVCLRADETVAGVCRALIHTTHNAFPVCAARGAPPAARLPAARAAALRGNARFSRRESVRSVRRNRTGVARRDRGQFRVIRVIRVIFARASRGGRAVHLAEHPEARGARAPPVRTRRLVATARPGVGARRRVSLTPADGVVPADELGAIPAHVPASRAYREFALLGARRVLVVESGGGGAGWRGSSRAATSSRPRRISRGGSRGARRRRGAGAEARSARVHERV